MNSPDSGIERLERRLAADPASKAFLPLAEECRRAGHLDRAIEILKHGLAKNPGYATAEVALARVYIQKGQPGEATVLLQRVLDATPENLLAVRLLEEAQAAVAGQATAAAAATEPQEPVAAGASPADAAGASTLPPAASDGSSDGPAIELAAWDADPAEESPGPAEPAMHLAPVGPPPGGPAAPPVVEDESDFSVVAAPEPDTTVDGGPARGSDLGEEPDAEMTEAAGEVPGELPGTVRTLTLARLYRRQGHMERAATVYRDLLEVDPGNAAARRELAEIAPGAFAPAVEAPSLEALDEIGAADLLPDGMEPEPGPATAAGSSPAPDPVPTAEPAAAPVPADDLRPGMGALEAERRRKIAVLRSWLERIRAEG